MKGKGLVCIGVVLSIVFLFSAVIYAAAIGRTSASDLSPVSSFTYTPVAPMPGDVITFNASASYDPDGYIIQYTWDFGDGNLTTTTNPTITHSYPIDADYTVELVVTDDSGATGASSAIVQVSTVVFFRTVFQGTLAPIPNVQVTVYYFDGSSWKKAPVGSSKSEIKYDNLTQPNLASTSAERYRNPGFTASILRQNASNIGFDIHPSSWKVYFKFEWGPYTAYWPNETTRVYTYKDGTVETHDYYSGHRAYWDATAGTYVINVNDIPGHGVSPCESHPIIVGILCPPPTQKYYLTVKTDPLGITTIPGQGLYDKDTNVTLTAPAIVAVSSNTQYRFNYWDVDGTSRGVGVNPITVQMNANHTSTAHYILQYSAIFVQTGLSLDTTGTVVTVDGVTKLLTDLPYTKWVDTGGSITYSYNSIVTSSTIGKRYRLNSVTGPTSPITVTGPATVTGNFVTQYLVTFAQTGLDSSATGTVVTVNGTAKTYTDLPFNWWVDSGSTVTYNYSSIVSSSVTGKQFRLTGVNCPPSQFIVTAPATITGTYCIQYRVTFAQTGLDSSATGTVVTVNGTAKTYGGLPYSLWVDSGSTMTYSYTSTVASGVSGKQFRLTGITGPASPITVTGPVSVTGNYVVQYLVTFGQSGLDSTATGTVVTVNGNPKTYGNLPYSLWVDSGSSVTYSYASPVASSTSGKQFRLTGVTGPGSPVTVAGPATVTGNYVVQYLVTFAQSGLDSAATGTVVTVNSTAKAYTDLPYGLWVGSGSSVTYAYSSPVASSTSGKQFRLTSVTGSASPITVTGPTTVTGNYVVQYQVSFTHSGLDSSASGTVVTVNGNAKSYGDLTYSLWVDSGNSVTYSYSNVSSSTAGKRFILDSVSGSSSPITVTSSLTITGNYVIQYQVTFNQSGLSNDYGGTVVTIDGNTYTHSTLPSSFWWNSGSGHTFSFASPLVVNATKQYSWVTTTGLSTLQSDTLTITTSGNVVGSYAAQYKYQVTFDQTGVNSDFTGTLLLVDGIDYGVIDLPVSFLYDSGSTHNFSYLSPLLVNANIKQYLWTSTSGLSSAQNGIITVTLSGSVIGNYKTQYYLAMATNPPAIASPSGGGWYDVGTNVTISTPAFVDIVPGSSRYRFNGWTTGDMSEISNPLASPTTVLVDKAKTVTANYAVQYKVAFNQTGVGLDFTGPVVAIDGVNYTVTTLPASFWWDNNTAHTFAFQSPLVAIPNSKAYGWANTTGLSTSQTGTLTILAPGSVTGNYKTQYYLTVTSAYDSPTPASGWFDAGASITASVTSPASGPAGTRYVGTGWSGTGSVPSSGSGTTTTFTITQASTITWNWKTQYYLTVETDPSALVTIPGEDWYDASSSVSLTAPPVTGWNFSNWDIDGVSQGSVNPINVNMNAVHTATAHYTQITGQPLTVSISPMAAATTVGNGVPFTSTVSGGTASYTYQWYLDGNPVSGATSSNWMFVPTTSGVHYVYVVVTDAALATAQSGTARVEVFAQTPVGGFSISMEKPTPFSTFGAYVGLLALFGTVLCLKKRKRK